MRNLQQFSPVTTTQHPGTAGFDEPARAMVDHSSSGADHLFAYPLESNFSGARYPLHLATTIQTGKTPGEAYSPTGNQGALPMDREDPSGAGACSEVAGTPRRWWVLLDAAKACSTCPPDLRVHKPDFVVSPVLDMVAGF